MNPGSQAVQDVVRAAAAFVVAGDECPYELTETQAQRFRELCNALEMLQALVNRQPR